LQEIKKSAQLSKYCDIRDLVTHIVTETRAAGKTYFYHDALTLMTCKSTREWMKEQGYLKMWFLPEQKLFEVDPNLKSFFGRVPGNSPEMMPLDKRLNKDLHEIVNQHYVLTNDLKQEDSRRFGLETPKQVALSYKRIWDPMNGVGPISDRIVQDINLVFEDAIPRIIIRKGKCLDDNNIVGRRYETKTGENKSNSNLGGKRVRKLALDCYGTHNWHKDVDYGIQVKLEIAKSTFTGVKLEQLEETFKDALHIVGDEIDENKEEGGTINMGYEDDVDENDIQVVESNFVEGKEEEMETEE